MKRAKMKCLDCRLLELKRSEDGAAVYWCAKKRTCLGATVLKRDACADFEPWQLGSRKEAL